VQTSNGAGRGNNGGPKAEAGELPLDVAREVTQLQALVQTLQGQLHSVERKAADAARDARNAREEVQQLRDAVAKAERDQQELRTVRARLGRLARRGLLARILNRR